MASPYFDALKDYSDSFERKKIKIKELKDPISGRKPMIIYSSPFTMNDRKKLSKLAGSDEHEFIVRAFILKAEDKEGNKIFDLDDKVHLMNMNIPNILTRVVAEMGNFDSPN
jgi:hypothetical protein